MMLRGALHDAAARLAGVIAILVVLVTPLFACHARDGGSPHQLAPDDVVTKLTAAGFKVEKQTGSYLHKFANEDLLLFFKLDGVELLGLRFPTATNASEWCQTRQRCVAADVWAIDADQRALPEQAFPAGRIGVALGVK